MKAWEQYLVAYVLLWLVASDWFTQSRRGADLNGEQLVFVFFAFMLATWCAFRIVQRPLARWLGVDHG